MRPLALLLTFAAAAAAQQSTPVFRATTRLVQVTVNAVDGKGNPVTDLKREEFTLAESGKAQEIALFQFEGSVEAPKAPSAPLAPGVFANSAVLASSGVRNVTAIVLDVLNTPPADDVIARAQVMRYLKALTPVSRVAVYMLYRDLRALHDFTDDPDALRRRMEAAGVPVPIYGDLKIEQSIQEAEELMRVFRDDPFMMQMLRRSIEADIENDIVVRKTRALSTLRAIDAMGQHLAGIRGRKNLVWVSGGISMLLTSGRGNTENLERQVRAVSQRLAQRGVTLYLVDTRGVDSDKVVTMLDRRPERPPRFGDLTAANDSNADPDAASIIMTAITGGRYLKNTNDMAAGLTAAIADVRGSYTLGFYTGREDDKWHPLQVRVNRKGVKLRHREGWIAESQQTEAPEWSHDQWRGAAMDLLGSTEIRLKAECLRSGGTVHVKLAIDPEDVAFHEDQSKLVASLHVVLAEVAGDKVRMPQLQNVDVRVDPQKTEELRQSGIQYTSAWTADGTATSLRLIVRDRRSGRYGTLDIPVARLAQAPI